MTLIPEHIIMEAIEKGDWRGVSLFTGGFIGCKVMTPAEFAAKYTGQILLDPDFWQALGKARRWEATRHLCPECGSTLLPEQTWQPKKFVELLLSSPSQEQIDRFWAELPS